MVTYDFAHFLQCKSYNSTLMNSLLHLKWLCSVYWWHFVKPVKTGPSITDVAMGRLAQGTKVFAEGSYEKIFRQTLDSIPEEQLLRSFACYLSTSAGPVMGILYQSTAKVAFCSDNLFPYKVGNQTGTLRHQIPAATILFLTRYLFLQLHTYRYT